MVKCMRSFNKKNINTTNLTVMIKVSDADRWCSVQEIRNHSLIPAATELSNI